MTLPKITCLAWIGLGAYHTIHCVVYVSRTNIYDLTQQYIVGIIQWSQSPVNTASSEIFSDFVSWPVGLLVFDYTAVVFSSTCQTRVSR